MAFNSILYNNPEITYSGESSTIPSCFHDLNLDLMADTLTAGREEYNLKPIYYDRLRSSDEIYYRQDVFKDLENPDLTTKLKLFGKKMQTIRSQEVAAGKLFYKYHRERWILETINYYCNSVEDLCNDLLSVDIKSEGLQSFSAYLKEYLNSDQFKYMSGRAKKILTDLSAIQYSILYRNLRVQVMEYSPATDYAEEIKRSFSRFTESQVKDYRIEYKSYPLEMNDVEAKILDGVVFLYPDVFADLEDFCNKHREYPDRIICTFDREIQFYISYLDFINNLRDAGLNFCYPVIASGSKEINSFDAFDIVLANKLCTEKLPVVLNDFYLGGKERVIIVSGPNQGGKTTFARMFGQLHYLSGLGCPVPGTRAQLFLPDNLLTHFEKEEDIKNLRGKLKEDLVRMNDIIQNATESSILILNEIFNSTTLQDQVFLSKRIMRKIIELDLVCVCVTFIDELADMDRKIVSMVSTIVPDNPAIRTYKVLRRPADGLAYAISIAEKYNLTYKSLKDRLKI